MPPKKKAKTATPAALPCFATARLTIIGANPVQRKIWAKCGAPTFLKPSQVSQLTGDRDFVVIACAGLDAGLVHAGTARVVTDRWLTASIERNALQSADAHAWPVSVARAAAPPPPPGYERPIRCVAYDCDDRWPDAVRLLIRDHRPHVVLLRADTPTHFRKADLGEKWRFAAVTGSTAVLVRCAGSSMEAPAGCSAWRSAAGDAFAVVDDVVKWAADQPRHHVLTVFSAQQLDKAGLRDAYALLRPGRRVPSIAPLHASCDSLRYGDFFAQRYGDANPLLRPSTTPSTGAELWTSSWGGGVHRLLDCCAASPEHCATWGRVLALDARHRTALGPGAPCDDVPKASTGVVFEGDTESDAKKEAGRRTLARKGYIQAFPSEALKEHSPLPTTRRVCAALAKVFKLEGARLGGDRKTRKPGEDHGKCNTQVLMFERAHAMVLSWPGQLKTDEDVYEKLVPSRPYMSVDGRPAQTVARALNGELDSWEACADSLRESSLNEPFETDALIAAARMSKVFGISIGDGVVDTGDERDRKLRGAYEIVQYLRKAGYGQRPSVDDAVDAMRGDAAFRAKLTQFATHGLDRHAEFFDAPLSEAEVLEGHALIMRGLRARDALWRSCVEDYDGDQWVVVRVGGARRRLAGDCGHDMDFLVTHPQICSYSSLQPVLDAILVGLNAERTVVDYGSGQQDLPVTEGLGAHVGSVLSKNTAEELANVPVIQQIRREITGTGSGWQHWDHLARHFGVFYTKAGKRRRRIDIVVSAHLEWPFALLSWTGGKVYNRLLRDYANKIGCPLSAHCLMTVPSGAGRPKLVPQETHPGTPVPRTEEDVLRLLGVPWLPPHLRDV